MIERSRDQMQTCGSYEAFCIPNATFSITSVFMHNSLQDITTFIRYLGIILADWPYVATNAANRGASLSI